MIEAAVLGVSVFLSVILGAVLVLLVWRQDRQTLENLFLVELKAGSQERERLLRLIASLQNKLASKDLAAYTAITEVDREVKAHEARRRDDATEALLARNNGQL